MPRLLSEQVGSHMSPTRCTTPLTVVEVPSGQPVDLDAFARAVLNILQTAPEAQERRPDLDVAALKAQERRVAQLKATP